MRSMTISAVEFENYIFPGFASQGAKTEDELEVRLRVLRKLKASSSPLPGPTTDGQGQRVFTGRTMDNDEAYFEFEEDEFKVLRESLVASLPMWSLLAQEEVSDILERMPKV